MTRIQKAAWKRKSPLATKTIFQLQKLARRGNAGAIMEMEERLAQADKMRSEMLTPCQTNYRV